MLRPSIHLSVTTQLHSPHIQRPLPRVEVCPHSVLQYRQFIWSVDHYLNTRESGGWDRSLLFSRTKHYRSALRLRSGLRGIRWRASFSILLSYLTSLRGDRSSPRSVLLCRKKTRTSRPRREKLGTWCNSIHSITAILTSL